MRIKALVCAALLMLAGCNAPVSQSVADSQRPPSNDVRQTFINIVFKRSYRHEAGEVVWARISSVVVLEPEKKIYAYCVRLVAKRGWGDWAYLGVSFTDGKILGATVNDDRCRDKRLRYYPFPELTGMKT
ncbi:hypothetical protein A6U98_18885 [Rhizobium sp. WYCCWR10014]|uniref:hypothetical protein n=1 Tax=Rhizobium sp. WYCCWR10014 TaxID=1825933 RepID=UPI0007E31B82|nr:hypothetical protein [Rhizobium sp. WYCCWR10014]OAV51701.1 hypothetical protein A6U98_18885 [Rhizobium sp. WYCCWR10014]